jgi:hypothetical protein
MNPWVKYGLLQVVAFLLGGGGLFVSFVGTVLVVWSGTMIASGILMVRGYVNSRQRGFRSNRLLVTLGLVFTFSLIFWLVLLGIICGILDASSLFAAAVLVWWAPWLALLSTGSLAYLALGPFRSRLSPMERTRQLIKEMPNLKVAVGNATDRVSQAERMLGVRFPVSFREFLIAWGEIDSPTIKFLGITPAVDLSHATTMDCVGATLEAREKCGIPHHYVLCTTDQRGQIGCLDTFSMRNDEGPVVLWDSHARAVTRILAPTFIDFLRDQLEAKSQKSQ